MKFRPLASAQTDEDLNRLLTDRTGPRIRRTPKNSPTAGPGLFCEMSIAAKRRLDEGASFPACDNNGRFELVLPTFLAAGFFPGGTH